MSGVNQHRKRMRHVWYNMKSRCEDPANPAYDRYGGRGIKICEGWRHSFDNFYEDMKQGQFPGCQLDRIDNDGPYSPENCRWVTPKRNSRNRANNRLVSLNGEAVPVAEASEKLGVPASVVIKRLDAGWTEEESLFIPVKRRYEYNGDKITTGQAVEMTGLDRSTLNKKLRSGMTMQEIMDWFFERGRTGRWTE